MSDNIELKELQCSDGVLKGRKYKLPSTACVFCNHCTDIDYSALRGNVNGECKMFESEESEE